MRQKYTIPEEYQNNIFTCINELGSVYKTAKQQAEAVQQLSNHYQDVQATTPWGSNWATAAFLCYYFPLNYIRNRSVFSHIPETFWEPLKTVYDYGSGGGTSLLALQDHRPQSDFEYIAVEISEKAHSLYERIKTPEQASVSYKPTMPKIRPHSLGIFSYSLNELSQPPNWISDFEALVIIEPSTRHFGRRLLELRHQLIDSGYHIWAPCTHHNSCPLLTYSKKDWCHDRVHWNMPDWFTKIESRLVIKNRTLTHSYLVASKSPPPKHSHLGRVVGDPLKEKGKTRWLFCRDEEREFLSWLKKQGPSPNYQRGDLPNIEIGEKKGNELRFNTLDSVES